MDIGQLDRRITLFEPTFTRNGAGEIVASYPGAGDEVWARVYETTAIEQIRNGLTGAAAPYAIRIRYRADVTEKWRIAYKGRTLEISSAVEFGRREATDIVATELRQ